jgi:hypothetical protein
MQHDPLSPTSMMRQLSSTDTRLQTTLRQKLSTLNIEMAEGLQQQPTFHSFVQHEFDQDFPGLTPRLDLRRAFIESHETPSSQTPQDVMQEAMPLLPSLMDTVVQRIVGNQASIHASRQTRFYRASDTGDDLEPVTELTPETFDTFLDRLATGLASHYKHYLETFWVRPRGLTDSRTHKQWLVDTRTEQLKTEVALLKTDKLLSAAGDALFSKVLRYPDALARQALGGYRPCVYGLALKDGASAEIPLYGAFVLTSRDPEDAQVTWENDPEPPRVRPIEPGASVGNVVLFSPENGLEEFDSLASLDRELHRRLNHAIEFTSVLALMAEKDQPRGLALHREGKEGDQVKYLERLDSPFSYGIESQCLQIQENVTSVVVRYQAQGVQADMAQLPESLDRVANLVRAFDASGVLSSRVKKRCQAQLKAFFKEANQADKDAWNAAREDYYSELANLPESDGLPSLAQFSDKSTLLAYSNAQLRLVLTAEYALELNPDDITVHTKEPYVPPIVFVPGGAAPAPREPGQPLYKTRSRTLTELGLENVGGMDLNFTNFSWMTDKAGKPYEELTPEQVKDLVRTVNVGESYDAFLKDRLITSSGAIAQKQTYARVMARQLRLDAIEARITGDFLPDRLARGFNWVQAVLDAPVDSDQRKQVEGHRVLVQSLKLRGQRVRGVLMFRTAASAAGGSIVVYTPQAPGGRVFHEYVDERLSSDFINNSSWRDYLLGRVEKAHQPQVSAVLRGRGDLSMIHMARIADNIFEEAYEVEANFAINDAGAQSATTRETNVETGITVATTALDIAAMVLPIKVMLPIGLARSLFSIFNAVEAAQLGDRTAAAHHVVRALGEFIGALVDGAIGARSGAVGSAAKSRGLNPEMAFRKKPNGLVPLEGWEGNGIYYKTSKGEASKQYFLNDQQHWYSILDDGDQQVWRIRDARKLTQHHYSPIRQDATGRWDIGTHPTAGGTGGNPPDRVLMDLYPFLGPAQARRVFDSFNFPRGREIEFELSLVHHLRSGTALDVFNPYLMVTPERLLLRLRGLDMQGTLVDAPVAGPSRPRPVEPIPGPSRPRPEVPRPVRPPNERFADWGQTLDPAELQLQILNTAQLPAPNIELGIYRRLRGDRRLIGQEYVKIDEHYYPILPAGGPRRGVMEFMHDPNLRPETFEQFEFLLGTDLFNQPRRMTFNADLSRWLHSFELPFRKTIVGYVAEAFPMFTATSQRRVARALFNRANPNGASAWGMVALQRTLASWLINSRPTRAHATLGDPLSLLPVTGRSVGGNWPLNDWPGHYRVLQFRTDPVAAHMRSATLSGSFGPLREMMIEVLVRSGYRVVDSPRLATELIFNRAGSSTVYCLTLRRTAGNSVSALQYTAPNVGLMEVATQNLVNQARASRNFIELVGGLRVHPWGGPEPEIFIIRV